MPQTDRDLLTITLKHYITVLQKTIAAASSDESRIHTDRISRITQFISYIQSAPQGVFGINREDLEFINNILESYAKHLAETITSANPQTERVQKMQSLMKCTGLTFCLTPNKFK